jgi:ubiquitin-protein ligase
MAAIKRLNRELSSLQDYGEFSCYPQNNNMLKWDIIIFGPNGTIYEGGIFKAMMEFDLSYPIKAPKFYFVDKITHPNIYKDGKVCISILHEGQDQFNYESLSERWNPQQGVASVLLSIISLLNEPNFESPANVDASVLWKNNFTEMKKIVYQEVAKSQN